jgi:hypothetical protein
MIIVDKNQPGKVVCVVQTGPQGPAGAVVGAMGTGFLHYTSGIVDSAMPVNPTTSGHMTVGAASTVLSSNGTVGAWVAVTTLVSAADDIGKSVSTAVDRVRGFTGVPFDDTADDAAAAMVGGVPVYNAVGGASIKFKKPSPPGSYDVEDYGLVGDGVTDNTATLQAILDGASVLPVARAMTLVFPEGNFYFAGNIKVTRPGIFMGSGNVLGKDDGAGNYAATRLTFAAGKCVLVEPQSHMPVVGGYADYARFENIQFVGSMLTLVTWASTTAKSVGALTKNSDAEGDGRGDNRYYYECIVAGTTGGTIPTFRNCYLPDYSTDRLSLTAYHDGQQVRVLGTSTTVYWECTVAGTTAGAAPAFDTTPGNTTTDGTVTWTARSATGQWITDGTVVWACKVAPAIHVRAHGVCIRDCNFEGHFTNAAIHVQSNPVGYPDSNCNQFYFDNLRIRGSGVGIALRGSDTSAGVGIQIDIENIGASWGGEQGGVGIWDGGFTGSTWLACGVAACTGRGWIIGRYDYNSGSYNPLGGLLVGCYMESDCDPPVGTGGMVLGGTFGQQWNTAGGTTTLGVKGIGQGDNFIASYDHDGPAHAIGYLGDQGYDTTHASLNDDNPTASYAHGLVYESTGLGRTGWWSWCHGPFIAGRSFSGLTAAEGRGWDWQPHGEFRGGVQGDLTRQYFVAFDTATMRNPRVRKVGEWKVGDRVEIQGDGEVLGYVVTAAGYRGAAWTALTAVQSTDQISIIEPTVNTHPVSTPGDQVWKCTTTGTTGAVEPTWPGAPTAGVTTQSDGSAVWTFLGDVPEYAELNVTDDAGSASDGGSGVIQTSDGAGGFTGYANVKAGSDYISIGATPAATGAVRLNYDASARPIVVSRNSGNSADWVIVTSTGSATTFGVDGGTTNLIGYNLALEASNTAGITLGVASSPIVTLTGTTSTYNSGTTTYLKAAGTTAVTASSSITTVAGGGVSGIALISTEVGFALPRHGYSSPYGSDGLVVISGSGYTLTSSDYDVKAWLFDDTAGGTFTIPRPTDVRGAYFKYLCAYAGAGAMLAVNITLSHAGDSAVITRDAVWRVLLVTDSTISEIMTSA